MNRDKLTHGNLATDGHQPSYIIVRKEWAFTVSRLHRGKSSILDVLRQSPPSMRAVEHGCMTLLPPIIKLLKNARHTCAQVKPSSHLDG